MQKQWWEYLIDAGITLFATGVGVYGAFYVDNIRDKTAKRDLKNRLIRGLSYEIDKLEKFLNDKLNLVMYQDYYVEIRILEDTVRDQIDYLDNSELIESLSDLRGLVKKVDRHLSLWNEVNIELRKPVMGAWGQVKDKLTAEWNGLNKETLSEIKTIKGLLEKETTTSK